MTKKEKLEDALVFYVCGNESTIDFIDDNFPEPLSVAQRERIEAILRGCHNNWWSFDISSDGGTIAEEHDLDKIIGEAADAILMEI